MIIWMLISILTASSYFYHYQRPPWHESLALIFKMPVEYVCFVFKYVGNICTQHVGVYDAINGESALVFGLMAIAAFAWAGWTLLRTKIADGRILLP